MTFSSSACSYWVVQAHLGECLTVVIQLSWTIRRYWFAFCTPSAQSKYWPFLLLYILYYTKCYYTKCYWRPKGLKLYCLKIRIQKEIQICKKCFGWHLMSTHMKPTLGQLLIRFVEVGSQSSPEKENIVRRAINREEDLGMIKKKMRYLIKTISFDYVAITSK